MKHILSKWIELAFCKTVAEKPKFYLAILILTTLALL